MVSPRKEHQADKKEFFLDLKSSYTAPSHDHSVSPLLWKAQGLDYG